MTDLFAPMSTFPRDGTRCQLLFQQGVKSTEPFFWGRELVGNDFCIRGTHNKMSPWLRPQGWRKFPETEKETKRIEEL